MLGRDEQIQPRLVDIQIRPRFAFARREATFSTRGFQKPARWNFANTDTGVV